MRTIKYSRRNIYANTIWVDQVIRDAGRGHPKPASRTDPTIAKSCTLIKKYKNRASSPACPNEDTSCQSRRTWGCRIWTVIRYMFTRLLDPPKAGHWNINKYIWIKHIHTLIWIWIYKIYIHKYICMFLYIHVLYIYIYIYIERERDKLVR